MKKSFCGSDCCEQCPVHGSACAGCAETNGHPCGGSCFAADLIRRDGMDAFLALKAQLIAEINALGLPELQIADLNLLNSSYVNLEYPLPGGGTAKLLQDGQICFANQIERSGSERCYGVAADETLLVVSEYGCGGADPELLFYRKKR